MKNFCLNSFHHFLIIRKKEREKFFTNKKAYNKILKSQIIYQNNKIKKGLNGIKVLCFDYIILELINLILNY